MNTLAPKPTPLNCPTCKAMCAGAHGDSLRRVWFTCGSAWRDGAKVVKGDECKPGRKVVKVAA